MAKCGIGAAAGTWAARRAPLLACDRPFVTIAPSARRHHPELRSCSPADAATPDLTGQTADFKNDLQPDALTHDE